MTAADPNDTTIRDADAGAEQPSTADLAAVRTPEATDVDALPDAPEPASAGPALESSGPLLGEHELDDYRSRWRAVQVRFVDEPRDTVKEADALVAELMQRLAQTFAEERSNLESQWERGTDVSTEDLRLAMQRYRSFFDRLLAA